MNRPMPITNVTAHIVDYWTRAERNPSLNVADSLAQGLDVPLWQMVKEADDLRKKRTLRK
ncbi:MAG TPA: hypothetical protein VGY56_14685 [Verrucomicrobiae bacterium]|nr:hypothetical protein [Verrucomicrobiae bacterium]